MLGKSKWNIVTDVLADSSANFVVMLGYGQDFQ